MAKPTIVVVDDNPEELSALEHDLQEQYSDQFGVIRFNNIDKALDQLKQMKMQNRPVALLLADQQMLERDHEEFFKQGKKLFPKARRMLLTNYADVPEAIRTINALRLDYYLVRPWSPPADHLYPVLNDLLEDWLCGFKPSFEGIRLIGHRWSPQTYQLKDFLARNQVPYQWLNIETNKEASELLAYLGADSQRLPVAILADGSYLVEPTNMDIAEKVSLKTHAELPFYDLIIVGSGPAGLAAAVYGSSEGLRTLMIEREAPGGQAGTSSRIENYLGFPSGLTGADLSRRAVSQAIKFGTEILTPQEAVNLRASGPYKRVKLADGTELGCHAVLISTGVCYRRLDVPGIERLTNAGIYYGSANTEAIACQDEEVYIVGGANSAGQAAIYFSRYAHGVTMLVRGGSLSKGMSQYLVDQIEHTENITVKTCTEIVEAHGEERLEQVTLENVETHKRETIDASTVFIFIGAEPYTEWLPRVIKRDGKGFILTGSDLMEHGHPPADWPLERDPYMLESSMPGIFVAGDARYGSIKRVASGVGEGSIAVQLIHRYLSEL